MNNTNSLNKWLWLVHEFSFLQFIADCHFFNKLVSWHFNLERINCLGRHFPPILSHCQRIHPFIRPLTPRPQLPFVLIVQLKPFNKLLPWIVLRLASLKVLGLHFFHCALLAGWSGRVSKYDQRSEGSISTVFVDSKSWNLRPSFLDLEKSMKT